MIEERKSGKLQKGIWGRACRYAAMGLLACFLFAAIPSSPAHAQCDTCVVGALIGLDADLSIFLGIEDGLIEAMDDLLAIVDGDLTAIELTLVDPFVGLPPLVFALYGGVPFVDGAFGIDDDMNGDFAAVVEAVDMHATESEPKKAQVGADAEKLYGDLQGQADLAPDAYVSQTTLHCATTYALSTRSVMQEFVHALTLLTIDQIRDRDTGINANQGANVFAQTVCEMAPFRIANGGSPRLSQPVVQALSNCPNITSAPNDLVDADIDIASVFDRMQYSFPTDLPTWTSNNHIIFTPESEDEWAYVAAWRYCEHYVPDLPPPPNGQNSSNIASLNDLQRVGDDSRAAVFKLPALRECMKAIAERTACSNGGANNPTVTINGNANTSCWQIQDIACHRLTDPPPSGLGLYDVGNEEVNYALANCDDNGLSLRAFDYAWSHRCSDPNYMSKSIVQDYASSDKVRQEAVFCEEDREAFDRHLRMNKKAFYTAVEVLMESHGSGRAPNPAAQPAYPNS